jgi:aspartyl-tRNA(Asn)/glutamyl-tRNA(Gln) amidotransferase subunit A
MTSHELCYLTISAAAAGLRRKDFSALELTAACLDRITAIDGKLHSFITITAELARDKAKQADTELRAGRDLGRLHGIPVALKDLYATKGILTTCHSAVLQNWIPDHDATATERLAQAGTILLGKLGMHEFAFGIPADRSAIPPLTAGSSGSNRPMAA